MTTTTATTQEKKLFNVTVILPSDELDRINTLAKTEKRSRSSMIRVLMNEAFKTRYEFSE